MPEDHANCPMACDSGRIAHQEEEEALARFLLRRDVITTIEWFLDPMKSRPPSDSDTPRWAVGARSYPPSARPPYRRLREPDLSPDEWNIAS